MQMLLSVHMDGQLVTPLAI